MKEIMFNPEQIGQFVQYLRQEERSEKTVEKYVRDLRCFAAFIGQEAVNKQSIIAYKNYLAERYAVTSANSMIAPTVLNRAVLFARRWRRGLLNRAVMPVTGGCMINPVR